MLDRAAISTAGPTVYDSPMLIIAGTIRFNPTKTDEARALVDKVVTATRAEDGNLDYSFAIDVLDPGLVRVFEAWRDQAAIDAHMASPHLAEFLGAVSSLDVTDVHLDSYEAGEPTRVV